MQAPKLLIVANVPSMLREFLLPFGEHFSKLGWQVDAMVSDAATCKECQAVFNKVWNVDWTRNPLDPSNFIRAPQSIRAVVEREKYDIVHVHSPVAAFVTRFALRRLRKQLKTSIIYTAHGFHFHRTGSRVKNQIFLTLEKIAGRWTDYLVVMNREDEAAARRYHLVPEDRLMYMPGIGVDLERYNPARVNNEAIFELRDELKLKPEEQLLLMIAEFNPGKRHRDALAALARLNNKQAVLAFAGVGPLEANIEALAKSLGVAEQTRFLGYRKDIPVLLRASSALLLPSEREGLPRSIMESLCLATPVISTHLRGVEDLLAEDSGIMTEVGDIEAISQAMQWVLEHPVEARAMGLKGQARMRLFSLAEVIRLHEELYEDVLGYPIAKPRPNVSLT